MKMISKFDHRFKLLMEAIAAGEFGKIKKKAIQITKNIVNDVKQEPLLSDNLGLDNDEDSKNFFNEIYSTIMKGSSRLNQGDVREIAFDLGITGGWSWLNRVNSRKEFMEELTSSKFSQDERQRKYGTKTPPKNCTQEEYLNWERQNPGAPFSDFKKYMIKTHIRTSDSPLDSMNREFALDFKNLIRLYNLSSKQLDNVKIDVNSLNGKNVVDEIYNKVEKLRGIDISKDFIKRIFDKHDLQKNSANIGRGELLIALFGKDAKWPPDNGDIQVGDKAYELKYKDAKIGRVAFSGKPRKEAVGEVHRKYDDLKTAFLDFLNKIKIDRSSSNALSLKANKKLNDNEIKTINEIADEIYKKEFKECFPNIKNDGKGKNNGKRFFNFDALLDTEWGFVGCTVRFFKEFVDIAQKLNSLSIVKELNSESVKAGKVKSDELTELKDSYANLKTKAFNFSIDGIYSFINEVANRFYNACLISNGNFNLGASATMKDEDCKAKRKEYLKMILDEYVKPGKDENDRERGQIDYIFYIDANAKVTIFDMNSESGKDALIDAASKSCPMFTDTNPQQPANRIVMPATPTSED